MNHRDTEEVEDYAGKVGSQVGFAAVGVANA